MANTLQIFEHSNFGSIRTMFDENGKVIFCGKDIAKALGYSDTVNALKQHCCGVVKHHLIDSLGRQQEATFIPESDVYRLIISSKLPSAEKFERWVFEEVLPTLMHEGSYSMNKTESSPFKLPSNYLEALEDLVETEKKRLILEAKIGQDAPYTATGKAITASHDCITIAEFVPILKEAGIENGHDGKRLWQNNLYAMLRADGFLLKRPNNMPSADARTEKIFFVEEKTNYDKYGNPHINTTTLITGKGQTILINYYKKKEGLL